MADDHELRAEMTRCVDERVAPGIVVAAGSAAGVSFLASHGLAQEVPGPRPMRDDTIFDLASLTKVICTTTLVAQLIGERLLQLDMPLEDAVQELRGDPKGRIAIAQLLTHTGGLPAHRRFWETCRGHDAVFAAIFAEPLESEAGTKRVYSDLGFMLLGLCVERVLGQALDTAARERIFEPLDMGETCFRPPDAMRPRCAATEIRPDAEEPLVGTVHDENAAALGGVAGQAGLFSTASDLAVFARMMINRGSLGGTRILGPKAFEALFTRDLDSPAGERWRGWDGVAPGGDLSGIFSASAFGHTGFTGTSIWIDPEQDCFVICLTNSVHPRRGEREGLGGTRLRVYRAGVGFVRSGRGR
jgi:CubicO group peptidase (beta-lactamase class C family)